MELEINQTFHIYNQGNNKRNIFLEQENYIFFLRKMRKYLILYSKIVAYCLMPNHFHWLILVHDQAQDVKPDETKTAAELLRKNIGILLSSYAQAMNKKYGYSGSLFRHRTKSVKIDTKNYAQTCFHYIHQNPIRGKLVRHMGVWPYSSFPDYAGNRNGTLVSKKFTFDYLDIKESSFLQESKLALNPKIIDKVI